MRNQTSFRLTTTLLPTDTTAKTTTVINKVDSDGNQFYPNFTDETVVITNDDRTVMETTRASCTNGAITFSKRGLSDDNSETVIANRKLTWNPGSICFITLGAGDIVDTGDDLNWKGDQTYTGNAVYDGMLISHKGIKYPTFASLEALQAYPDPFAGMFAVLDSDGELYRYNAVTEQRDVVTTSTPAQPAQASTTAIGTVRGATDEEFEAGTATGSNNELLVPTPAQIKDAAPTMELHFVDVNLSSDPCYTAGTNKTVTYTVPHDGFVCVLWTEYVTASSKSDGASCNRVSVSGTSSPQVVSSNGLEPGSATGFTAPFALYRRNLYAVKAGTFTVKIICDYAIDQSDTTRVKIESFFYFL